ncbi:hypothetical protein [Methanococcus maripaludis]|uniref:Uncharacterized protein n=1 Tax=Methanococcus maripaludis TaxID=39152 RepID=A0A8T3VUQ7_METMI|nr:hypothetical protein [Methanococcus maripaludis]MBG0768306.1 hypothetical protein [Methanococcus maripaludis]
MTYTDLKRVLHSKNNIIIRNLFEGDIDDTVYIYHGYSVQKLMARFTIKKIICDVPVILWKKTKENNSFSKHEFRQYCKELKPYLGIYIKDLEIFQQPIDPHDVFENFKVPCNYCKLTGRCGIFKLLRSSKIKIKNDDSLDPYFEWHNE